LGAEAEVALGTYIPTRLLITDTSGVELMYFYCRAANPKETTSYALE
jgi:hypothetical protein